MQCNIADCQFAGTKICRWDNCCLMSKRVGGCGMRYCQAHEYKKEVTKAQHGRGKRKPTVMKVYDGCLNCGNQLEEDVARGDKIRTVIGLTLFFTISIVLLVVYV